MKEKRESVRIELECPATCRSYRKSVWLGTRRGKPCPAVTAKASLMGVRIATEETFEVGSDLEIDIALDKIGFPASCQVIGTVMWEKPCDKTGRHLHGIRLGRKGRDTEEWERIIREKLQHTDREIKSHTLKS